jgi:hypothetical protein
MTVRKMANMKLGLELVRIEFGMLQWVLWCLELVQYNVKRELEVMLRELLMESMGRSLSLGL